MKEKEKFSPPPTPTLFTRQKKLAAEFVLGDNLFSFFFLGRAEIIEEEESKIEKKFFHRPTLKLLFTRVHCEQ